LAENLAREFFTEHLGATPCSLTGGIAGAKRDALFVRQNPIRLSRSSAFPISPRIISKEKSIRGTPREDRIPDRTDGFYSDARAKQEFRNARLIMKRNGSGSGRNKAILLGTIEYGCRRCVHLVIGIIIGLIRGRSRGNGHFERGGWQRSPASFTAKDG